MNLIAQLFGILALISLFFSYQQIKKNKFLILQIIANLFYAIQYLLLNAYSAIVSNIVSILRSIIVYYFEKKNKKTPIYMIIIIEILIIITGILMAKNIYSLIPIIIAFLYTLGVCQENLKYTYIIGVIAAILWILYNYIVGAYISTIGSAFEFISAFLGLIKVRKHANSKR